MSTYGSTYAQPPPQPSSGLLNEPDRDGFQDPTLINNNGTLPPNYSGSRNLQLGQQQQLPQLPQQLPQIQPQLQEQQPLHQKLYPQNDNYSAYEFRKLQDRWALKTDSYNRGTLRERIGSCFYLAWPPGRTYLAILLFLLVLCFTASMGAISDTRVPGWYRPLVDIGHEVFGPWGIPPDAQHFILIAEVVLGILYGLFIYNGPVPRILIGRRLLWVLCWVYFFRGLLAVVTTMPPTVVPCDLAAAHQMSIFRRVVSIVKDRSLTCSDLMYSGHTSFAIVIARFMEFYAVSPCPRYPIGRTIIVTLWWIFGGLVFWLSFATQNHHTGDVIVAGLVAWAYTTIYHMCIKLTAERRRLDRVRLALMSGNVGLAEKNLGGRRSTYSSGARESGSQVPPVGGSYPITQVGIDQGEKPTEETRLSNAHTNDHGLKKQSRHEKYDLNEEIEIGAQFYGPCTLLAFIDWIDRP